MVFITKSYQDLFGVRSYINALFKWLLIGFNSGIGKVHIALDCSMTILTLLQFAELHLSDITIRLYYHYVYIVYLFKKSMNDVR